MADSDQEDNYDPDPYSKEAASVDHHHPDYDSGFGPSSGQSQEHGGVGTAGHMRNTSISLIGPPSQIEHTPPVKSRKLGTTPPTGRHVKAVQYMEAYDGKAPSLPSRSPAASENGQRATHAQRKKRVTLDPHPHIAGSGTSSVGSRSGTATPDQSSQGQSASPNLDDQTVVEDGDEIYRELDPPDSHDSGAYRKLHGSHGNGRAQPPEARYTPAGDDEGGSAETDRLNVDRAMFNDPELDAAFHNSNLEDEIRSPRCCSPCDRLFAFDNIYTNQLVSSAILSDQTLLYVRTVIFLYCAAVMAAQWYFYVTPAKWLVYFTNWTQVYWLAYLVLCIALGALQLTARLEQGPLSTSLSRRACFILYELSFSWSIVVVVLYWTCEYTGDLSARRLFFSIHVHGLVLLCCLIELFVSRVSFVLSHMLIAQFMLCVYAVVNVVYTSQSGPLYTFLKWENPFSVLAVVGILVGLLFPFFIGLLLVRARQHCQKDFKNPLYIY